MKGLAKRMNGVEASATLAITSLAKSMKASGQDVVNFGAGEPDFDTPDVIKKAAKDAIDKGFTKYTPSSGIPELKKAISEKFARENNIKYDPSQIIISCGAKHSLYNVFQAICNEGDEVIIISPYWLSYPEMVRLASAKPVIIKTKESDGFKIKIGELKKKISKNTKAVIVNSPSNPAGIVYNKKELEEIADVITSKKIYCVSDEIYEKLIYDGGKHVSIGSFGRDIYEQTITVNGVSKTYSMTGWRIGYLGAGKDVSSAMSVLQSHSTSNPTSISQKAALAALNMDNTEIEKWRAEFEKRRDFIAACLDGVKAISYTKPKGAFYVYCNISKTGLKAKEFAEKLLKEKLVAVIPGESFGSDEHIRLSFATSKENIKKGVDRIKEWLRQ